MSEDGELQVEDLEIAEDDGAAEPAPKPKPAKPRPAKAKKDTKKKAQQKKRKGSGKKSTGGDGASVASHPRASAQIRAAKAWTALLGFALAGALSLKANVPPEQIGLRALGAGAAGYMIGWACAVTVWRQLLVAELRAKHEQLSRPPTQPAPSPAPEADETGAGG